MIYGWHVHDLQMICPRGIFWGGENRLRTSSLGVCYLSPGVIRHVVFAVFGLFIVGTSGASPLLGDGSCCFLRYFVLSILFLFFVYSRYFFACVAPPVSATTDCGSPFFFHPQHHLRLGSPPFPSCLLCVRIFCRRCLMVTGEGGGNTPTLITGGFVPALSTVLVRNGLPQP